MTGTAPIGTIDVAALNASILAQVQAEMTAVTLATNVAPMVGATTNVGIPGTSGTGGTIV